MLLFLRRPLRIVTGYVCACLVAGLALAVVVVWQLPDHSLREVLPNMVGATIALARVAIIVGLLPSLLAVVICEWRAERRWWVYSIFSACLAAAAARVISGALEAPVDIGRAALAIAGCAVVGLAAGWIYWRMAGRFAGRERCTDAISERA